MDTRDQLAVAGSRYDVDNGPTQLLLRHTTVSTILQTRKGEAIKQDRQAENIRKIFGRLLSLSIVP
jgi:hypothetical protein